MTHHSFISVSNGWPSYSEQRRRRQCEAPLSGNDTPTHTQTQTHADVRFYHFCWPLTTALPACSVADCFFSFSSVRISPHLRLYFVVVPWKSISVLLYPRTPRAHVVFHSSKNKQTNKQTNKQGSHEEQKRGGYDPWNKQTKKKNKTDPFILFDFRRRGIRRQLH